MHARLGGYSMSEVDDLNIALVSLVLALFPLINNTAYLYVLYKKKNLLKDIKVYVSTKRMLSRDWLET